MKILTEIQVHHSPFFSSLVDSIQAFGVDHILFRISMFSHAGAILNRSPLTILLSRSAQNISEGSSFHSRLVQPILRMFSHSSHLI